MGPMGEPGMLHSGLTHMNRFVQAVESFTSFSRLLDMNVDAMNGTLGSLMRFVDVAGEFFYILKTFAIVKLLLSPFGAIYRLILGTPRVKRVAGAPPAKMEGFDVSEFRQKKGGWKVSSVIALVLSLVGLPIVIAKIWASIQQRRLMIQEGLANGTYVEIKDGEDEFPTAVAVDDFNPERTPEGERDLPLRKGETVKILGQPFPDWWEGETADGRRGLFPQNFVQLKQQLT